LIPKPFSAGYIEAAFDWWLFESAANDPAALLHRLRLPGTRRAVLNSLRDRQLVAAATLLEPEAGCYGQAIALQSACREFAAHLWPAWQRLKAPPAHAKPVAEVLFWAFKFGAENTRNSRPHTPADWSLSAFRKLLEPLHETGRKSA
jgi:hypothetical protein